jgi:spore coat protein CotF
MNSLQEKINQEINALPLNSQKEVLDFVLFLKKVVNTETDSDYLSKNPDIKQAIIDGLNTPINECSDQLDW